MENENKGTAMNVRQITLIGAMAAVLCVLGPLSISLPITVVPISLTGFAIYLTVYVLGWKRGLIAYGIYFLAGLAGLPVFSGFSGGLAKVAGPTGGYLIGFFFLAFFSGWFVDRFPEKRIMHIVGMLAGNGLNYAFGTVWLALLNHLSLEAALLAGVVPFLPGDALKIAGAVLIGPSIRKRLDAAMLR